MHPDEHFPNVLEFLAAIHSKTFPVLSGFFSVAISYPPFTAIPLRFSLTTNGITSQEAKAATLPLYVFGFIQILQNGNVRVIHLGIAVNTIIICKTT